MTKDELLAVFAKHEDEYLKAELDGPSDLAAFNLLHKLVPSQKDVISASEHDEFYLSYDLDEVAAAATEEDLLFLIRCGLRLDSYDGFCMFA